ncbi:histidine kinase N-terminal 7TM domain-containing protein [Halobium salinum]|uniref:histidine kinase n=1 Tax=Halobium salinum TaxID=1364940 RepID=A0ABD5PG22_9EURY|nr:histidine kinase N-terminal 7TM domain-containing protein [Halobium salinum]
MTARLALAAALFASVVTSLAVATIALRNRSRAGATPLAAAQAAAAWWALGRLSSLYAPAVADQLFWVKLLYVGTVAAPVAWVTFALAYTNRGYLVGRRSVALLSVVPAVSLALLWTTPVHDLFYRSADVVLVLGSVPTLRTVRGPGYWVMLGYSFLLMGVGTALLLERALRTTSIYRRQAAALVAIALVPWASSLLYIARLVPVLLTPMMLAVSGVIALWAISRYGLLDIVPVARATVLDVMEDGVVVLDGADRVVDCNPAAAPALAGPRSAVLSRHAADALADPRLAAAVVDGGPQTVELSADAGAGTRQFEARVSTVDAHRRADDEAPGRLVLLRDVTESRRYRRELEAKNRRLDRFASVVSHDLRNPLNVAHGYATLLAGDAGRATGASDAGGADRSDAGGTDATSTEADHARTVVDALDRMDAIIDDVLELSRSDDSLDSRPGVPIEVVAKRAWSAVDTGRATLRCDPVGEVTADASQLQRAFENLFRNSVEHGTTSGRTASGDAAEHGSADGECGVDDAATDTGDTTDTDAGDTDAATDTTGIDAVAGADSAGDADPSVTVRVGPLPEGDGFAVGDDGPGIPEADRGSVFEPGHTTRSGNTGFGLAVVKRVFDAHGWQVAVTDGPTGGARFEVVGVDVADGTRSDAGATTPHPSAGP